MKTGHLHVYCLYGHLMRIPLYALYMYIEEDADDVVIEWKCVECNQTTRITLWTKV